MKKSIFYYRKARNPGISSETTWESRVRRPENPNLRVGGTRPNSWGPLECRGQPGVPVNARPLSQCKAAQSIIANSCIARELTSEGIIQTFAIIFQTHPKTRQNPLRKILFVLRQKYTLIFPVIVSGISRTFPGFFLGLKTRFVTNLFSDEKIDF